MDGGNVELGGRVDTRTDAELVSACVVKVTGVVDVDSVMSWHEDNGGRH